MKKLKALLFTLTSVVFLSLTGCSTSDTFTEKSYSSGKTEIEKITIQVTDRELEICESEDNQIYIDYFESEKEYLNITISENNELLVKLEVQNDWKNFIGTKPSAEFRKINIRIPNELISTLSASTSNEAINLISLSVTNDLTVTNNGGNILCEKINVGKTISLTTKNGNIEGTILGGWDDFSITCKIKKGDCNLPLLKEEGEKALIADCNNGNINIKFIK